MKRLANLGLAACLVLAACGGDDDAVETTATTTAPVTTAAVTTTVPPTTTTAAPATTTTSTTTTTTSEPPQVAPPDGSMLITNEDGVFVVTLDGVAAQVLEADPGVVGGMVDFAIDDTRAGIVVHPHRNSWFNEGVDTVVYWAPEGAGALQQLLVPAADQILRLEDVQPQGDGVIVYYTRRSGETPETAEQTLRAFDLDAKTVTELAVVGGWESGTSPISVGGSTIVRNGSGEAYFWIIFTDLESNLIDSPANPIADGFDCVPDCFYYGDLSPDGSLVAFGRLGPNSGGFFTVPQIEVREVATGDLVMSVTLPELAASGYIDSLDLSGTHVLINIVEEGSVYPVATVVDLVSGGVSAQQAAVGGVARFLRSMPNLDGVVGWP
ncbi:MAG: hypothetical protein QNJ81_10405 [Acidimicrobiia bacterium]|nr:hypothetical protein [Acidimicrobiia bacterium]